MTRSIFAHLVRYICVTVIASPIDCGVLFTFRCIAWRGLMQCRHVSSNHSRVIVTVYRYRCTCRVRLRSRLRLLSHSWCSSCDGCVCSRSIRYGVNTIIGTVMTSRMQVFSDISTTDWEIDLIWCSMSNSIHRWGSWPLIIWTSKYVMLWGPLYTP